MSATRPYIRPLASLVSVDPWGPRHHPVQPDGGAAAAAGGGGRHPGHAQPRRRRLRGGRQQRPEAAGGRGCWRGRGVGGDGQAGGQRGGAACAAGVFAARGPAPRHRASPAPGKRLLLLAVRWARELAPGGVSGWAAQSSSLPSLVHGDSLLLVLLSAVLPPPPPAQAPPPSPASSTPCPRRAAWACISRGTSPAPPALAPMWSGCPRGRTPQRCSRHIRWIRAERRHFTPRSGATTPACPMTACSRHIRGSDQRCVEGREWGEGDLPRCLLELGLHSEAAVGPRQLPNPSVRRWRGRASPPATL